jgi:hypothetical protein
MKLILQLKHVTYQGCDTDQSLLRWASKGAMSFDAGMRSMSNAKEASVERRPALQIGPPTVMGIEQGNPYLEQCYQLPTEACFDTVKAAVSTTLRRRLPTQAPQSQEVAGCVIYTVPFGNTEVQLFVLYVSTTITVIRLHPYRSEEETRRRGIHPAVEQGCRDLLDACQENVCEILTRSA